MNATLNRRGFLMGAGAAMLLPPSRLFAQGMGGQMGVTSAGTMVFSGGNSIAQRQALSRVATGLAATAPTRASATTTFNLIARRAVMFGTPTSPMGAALAAGIGGAYALFQGNNPLDGLLDLSVGNSAIELRYAAACKDFQGRTDASQESSYSLGIYNDVAAGSTSCNPRFRTWVYRAGSSFSLPPAYANDGWRGDASIAQYDDKRNIIGYRILASKALSANGGTVRVPPGAELKNALTATQKVGIISNAALNALGFGMYGDAKIWQGGGFTGGGGGSFGGGGATGYWGDDVGQAIMANKPVRGGVVGNDTWFNGNPTFQDADTNPPGTGGDASSWSPVTYPDKPMFPDDPGYNGSPSNPGSGDPSVPSNPGTTNPGTSNPGPDCYPGQVNCPAKVDWGSPPAADTDSGIPGVTPMDWFPAPFVAPAPATSCTPFSGTLAWVGNVVLDPCPTLATAFPVIKPFVLIGGTIAAGRTLLDT